MSCSLIPTEVGRKVLKGLGEMGTDHLAYMGWCAYSEFSPRLLEVKQVLGINGFHLIAILTAPDQ